MCIVIVDVGGSDVGLGGEGLIAMMVRAASTERVQNEVALDINKGIRDTEVIVDWACPDAVRAWMWGAFSWSSVCGFRFVRWSVSSFSRSFSRVVRNSFSLFRFWTAEESHRALFSYVISASFPLDCFWAVEGPRRESFSRLVWSFFPLGRFWVVARSCRESFSCLVRASSLGRFGAARNLLLGAFSGSVER